MRSCSVLDMLQRFSRRGWESRREMTSAWTRNCVVSSVRSDQILGMLQWANLQDQVRSVIEDYDLVPCHRQRRYRNILNSEWQVQASAWNWSQMQRERGLGTLCIKWNLTSLAGRKPKLVQEVVLYQLDKAELTSIHSAGSGTKLLKRRKSIPG